MPQSGPGFLGQLFTVGAGANTAPRITSLSPASGRIEGGTSVTITGFEFVSSGDGTVPEVYFDGVIAENIVVVDRNTITLDTPEHLTPGLVEVRIRTLGGEVSLPEAFQYYDSQITDVIPRFDTIAGGAVVTIRGYNFVDGSTIRFGGTAATVQFIDSETFSVIAPAHGAGHVDIVIEDPDGNLTTFRSFQYTLFSRTESFRRQPGIVINDTLGEAPNTMQVTLDGGTSLPVVGEEIEYLDEQDGNRVLFRGIVQSVTQDYEGQIDQLVYRVHAVDFTFILNKYRPFGTYTLTSVSDIVKDLIRRYAGDFSDAFVQTNLARVSITFDGTRSFTQCLTDLGNMIGGGHWYVDYERRIHFFHIVPPGIQVPSGTSATVSPGLLPMTVTQGDTIEAAFSYEPGWYIFRRTDYFDNNVESALGVMSDPVFLDGRHAINFSDVAVGVAAGSLNVAKRRIYVNRLLGVQVSSIPTTTAVNPYTPLLGTSGSAGYFYGYALVVRGENGGYSTPSSTRLVINVGNSTQGKGIGDAVPPSNYIATGDVIIQPLPAGGVSWDLYRTEGQASVSAAQSAQLHLVRENVPPGARYLDRTRDADLSSQEPPSSNNATYTRYTTNIDQGTTLLDQPERFLQIEDNVTTAFTVWAGQTTPSGPINASVGTVSNIPGTEPIPKKPFSARPAAPKSAPAGQAIFDSAGRGGSAAVDYRFRYAYLYRDGSVSYASPSSGPVYSTGGVPLAGFNLTSISAGPSVNGVECIARLIYLAAQAEWTLSNGLGLLLGNEATSLANFRGYEFLSGPSATSVNENSYPLGRPNKPFLGAASGGATLEPDPIPLWPNPDGPFLEGGDTPDDIDDTNEDLLRDPSTPVSVSWDLSQVRNRVYVKGRGSVAGEDTSIGSTTVLVADGNAFSLNGGQVLVNEIQVLRYNTVSLDEETGLFYLQLSEPVRTAIRNGESIVNFLQVDNEESQKTLGKIELDSNGHVTDGVHEYTVIDSSLKSSFQMYMRAFAELEVFSNPIITVRYSTRDPLTRSGKTVHIDLTDPPVKGDFLIQDVSIDQIHDESDDLAPRYTATASSVRFELNDLLLRILDQDRGFATGGGGGGPLVGVISSTVSQVDTGGEVVDAEVLIARITLNTAEIGELNGTPKILIPAPGVGKMNVITQFTLVYNKNGGANTAWTGNPQMAAVYEGNTTSLGVAVNMTLADTTARIVALTSQAAMANQTFSTFDPENRAVAVRFTADINPGASSIVNATVTAQYYIANLP